MTLTIEPNDFGQDIIDSMTPLLGAIGLLDSNGNLDVNNWSLDKALGVFGTYERTELILNLLSGYLAQPTYVLRERSTGLIVDSGELPSSETREEEWFAISQGEGWSVNLTVCHEQLSDYPFDPSFSSTDSPHRIELGIGIHLDDMVFTLNSGDMILSGHLGIPIIEVMNKESSGSYEVANDVPIIDFERLIWCDPGTPLSRTALSLKLRPAQGRFGASAPSAEAIALRTAFGKETGSGNNDGLVATIYLLDFVAKPNDLGGELKVDLVDMVSGGLSGVIDQIIPALVEMLPDGAQTIVENVLPMIGLLDSDWSSWTGASGAEPDWPRIDVMALIDDLDDLSAVWARIRSFLLSLPDPPVATQWLSHLYNLIFAGTPPVGAIEGSCTIQDPISLKLVSSQQLSVKLLLALWQDTDGTTLLDVGIRAAADRDIGTSVNVEGGMTVWIASIPLSGGRPIAFIPELNTDFLLKGQGTDPLLLASAGNDGSPMANLQIKIQKARLGVSIARDGSIDPLVELLEVTIGAHPDDKYYPVIDLTSGASVMQALEGALQSVLNLVSDALALHPVLQWIGSLVGLVAPRGYPFRRVDEEYGYDVVYEKGQLVFHLDKVYEVTVGGTSPATGHEPTHSGGTEVAIDSCTNPQCALHGGNTSNAGPLKMVHLGDNTPIWETNDTSDKRISLLDLVQNPLNTISEYHRTLLDDDSFDYDGEVRTAWVYVFEALGNLVNTGLAPLMKAETPEMLRTNQTNVTGSGTETSPWRIPLANDGDLPNFSLVANPTRDGGGMSERIQLGLGATISIIGLRPNLHLELGGVAELVSIPLVSAPQSSIPILLPRIKLDVFLHDAFANTQIYLLKIPGLVMTIEGLSTSIEWRRTQGIGWVFSINCPRIGSTAPDFKHLGTQITPAEMHGFLWNGKRLWLPDQSYLEPDLESFISQDDDPDDDIFVMPGTSQSVTIKWNFFGLGCPSMGFNTWSGLFGFIDQDVNVNSFIDLEPNQSIIENEGVRMILGQIMALRGGGVGFFASTFFRINPHMLYMDLGRILKGNGYAFAVEDEGPSNWPSNWAAYHPRGRKRLGLGPFSIPYDWPEIDWPQLISSPAEEIGSFITDVFSGISQSGEPFALAAMRWIAGFFRSGLPDLSSPTLGWPVRVIDGIPTVMMPDVPSEVSGDGTYERPWKINLSEVTNSKVELLLWLDPDGPNSNNQIQNVLTSSDMKVLNMLEDSTYNSMKLVQHTPDEWHLITADILLKLANYSPRVKHAVGDISKIRLADDLLALDQFLKNGDGFSTISNQAASNLTSVVSLQLEPYLSSYITSPQNHNIILEIFSHIQDTVSADWSPSTPGINPMTVILVHTLNDMEFTDNNQNTITNNPWYKLYEFIGEQYNVNAFSATSSQWVQQMTDDLNLFQNHLPTLQSGQGLIELRLSSKFNNNTEHLDGMAKQIKLVVDQVRGQNSGKVSLVAHGVSGMALMQLVNNSELDDTMVSGILTLNTPHNQSEMLVNVDERIRRAIHLISLLETDNLPYSESNENQSALELANFALDNLLKTTEQTSTIVSQLSKEVSS